MVFHMGEVPQQIQLLSSVCVCVCNDRGKRQQQHGVLIYLLIRVDSGYSVLLILHFKNMFLNGTILLGRSEKTGLSQHTVYLCCAAAR